MRYLKLYNESISDSEFLKDIKDILIELIDIGLYARITKDSSILIRSTFQTDVKWKDVKDTILRIFDYFKIHNADYVVYIGNESKIIENNIILYQLLETTELDDSWFISIEIFFEIKKNESKIFSINEWSKNDPIPELRLKNNLGIILLGAPGIGKSTFVNNFILPRNQNIKTFSTDDVSLRFSKDPNIYHKGSSELNLNRLLKFIETGQSFIYDTTGTKEKNIMEICDYVKENNYTLIFIHLVGPLDLSIKQNLNRTRRVPDDFIKTVYNKQFSKIGKYSRELNPDSYYIVQNKNGKYKFEKYSNGEIFRRKSDKYVQYKK